MRSWEHDNEPSGSTKHGSFIGAVRSFALGNVLKPLKHEAVCVREREREREGVPAVHTRQRFDTLILCIVVQGLSNAYYTGCSVKWTFVREKEAALIAALPRDTGRGILI
jgi:hypothetical protein